MSSTAQLQRVTRKWHGKVSGIAFIFFFIISVTAILLGWKNMFAAKIYTSDQPQKIAKTTREWLPVDSLIRIATLDLKTKVPHSGESKVISLNAFPDKGTIRFSFKDRYIVQLNATSGELMSIERKATDLFIKVHDGEILDDLMHSKNGAIKTTYTSLMGLALFFLTLTGLWLRFGPKKLSAKK